METTLKSIRGTMKGGVAIPDSESRIPDGTPVEISVRSADIPAEFRAEFEQWQQLSARAWNLIDAWELEERQ